MNILESIVQFKDKQIVKIVLLIDFTPSNLKPYTDVRAIYADSKPKAGYTFIHPKAKLSAELLKIVAGFGMETPDRDKLFPNWKQNLKS